MIIVVEGKNDYNKLKSIFKDANILITNGSSVSDEFIKMLKEYKEEIVLCLDPDHPGEKIRNKITNEIKNVSHVFVEKKKAISKNHKKVGIEHMSKEDIIEAFKNIKVTTSSSTIKMIDLYNLGLLGNESSSVKREKICKVLNIGVCNGKTFLNRLNMFNIKLEDVEKLI